MNASALLPSKSARTHQPLPLLEKGFRPFFLFGAGFAVVAVPLWLLALRGGLQPGGALGAMQWHAHEMLFGFSTAIIAGFLLTAVSNWSGRETAVGGRLAALVALWTMGRLALFFASQLPRYAPAAFDLAFLPALLVACAVPLLAARNRRNYGFIGLLLLLWGANGVTHAAALLGDLATVRVAQRVALNVILLMIVLMTGRVVPMFTRNATRLAWIRNEPWLERASIAAVLLLGVTDVWPASPALSAVVAAVAAVVLLARMRFWGSRHSAREPLLWILHVGTLWLPLGLLLRAASALTPAIPESSSLHALTAGAIGSLTLGMMARVSLGHTGRLIEPARSTQWSLVALVSAAVVRVGAPFLPSAWYLNGRTVASLLWSGAFTLFLCNYLKILCSPRADAR